MALGGAVTVGVAPGGTKVSVAVGSTRVVVAVDGAGDAVAAGLTGCDVIVGNSGVALAGASDGVALGAAVRVTVAVSRAGVEEAAAGASGAAVSVTPAPPPQLVSASRKIDKRTKINNALFKTSPPGRICSGDFSPPTQD